MKLIINCKDFKNIREKSSYNHNYYKYIGNVSNHPTEILEICHEDFNFCEYRLIKDNTEIFLGCSQDYIDEGVSRELIIDFQYYYT